SVPTLESAMGGPSGTTAPSPVRATVIASGVSKHCAPDTKYQPSGPECRCTAAFMPGVKTASMYRAVYCLPAVIDSGPMAATRSPLNARHSESAMVWTQTYSNDSTTVPRGPLAVSAAARLG